MIRCGQRLICRFVVIPLLCILLWLQYRLYVWQQQLEHPPPVVHDEKQYHNSNNRATSSTTTSPDLPSPQETQECFCSKKMPWGSGRSAASIWKQHQVFLWKALVDSFGDAAADEDSLLTIRLWTRELIFDILTPSRLERSWKSSPHPQILEQMARKVYQRIVLLRQKQKQKNNHPTATIPQILKIVVFGGSIVEGVGCDRLPPLHNIPGGGGGTLGGLGSLQECAWPHRLEFVLNQFLSFASPILAEQQQQLVVRVHNLAVGGTHSGAAAPILEYSLSAALLPDDNDNPSSGTPDIIINAYSANDNLPPAFHNTQNTTRDQFYPYWILERNMAFVHAATETTSGNCDQKQQQQNVPLILYVNDYLGNQQESIWGEGTTNEMIQFLSDHEPHVAYISAAHMVQHYVYADTTESFFSGIWQAPISRRRRKQQQQQRQSDNNNNDTQATRPTINVHFGVAGHVTTMISILYGFLRMAMEYCEHPGDVAFPRKSRTSCPKEPTNIARTTTKSASAGTLHRQTEQQWSLPVLNRFLQFDLPTKEWVVANQPPIIIPNVTEFSWKTGDNPGRQQKEIQQQPVCDGGGVGNDGVFHPPCVFAFLAAPFGTHKGAEKLATYLAPFTRQSDNDGGWEAQNNKRQGGFQNKLGLVATRPKAYMQLAVDDLSQQPIRAVTLHYLKSYGDLWSHSRAQFRVQVFLPAPTDNNFPLSQNKREPTPWHEESFELEGFHEQNVSIAYIHRLKLQKAAPIGSSFRFHMELVNGKIFKIIALMFCSR